jgi:hypothetical protein
LLFILDLLSTNTPHAVLTATDFGIIGLLLQVWGCGGKEVVDRALAAQDKTREDTAAAIRRARTVSQTCTIRNKKPEAKLIYEHLSVQTTTGR